MGFRANVTSCSAAMFVPCIQLGSLEILGPPPAPHPPTFKKFSTFTLIFTHGNLYKKEKDSRNSVSPCVARLVSSLNIFTPSDCQILPWTVLWELFSTVTVGKRELAHPYLLSHCYTKVEDF